MVANLRRQVFSWRCSLIAASLQRTEHTHKTTDNMSRLRRKTNKMTVRPAKTQISLGICPVGSESSLSAWRKLGSLATQWAHSEDADQTGRMPRLIWVFPWAHSLFVVFVIRRFNYNNKSTYNWSALSSSCEMIKMVNNNEHNNKASNKKRRTSFKSTQARETAKVRIMW